MQDLKAEWDVLVDEKREKEFEVIMLEEASKTVQAKEEMKREDVKHKIETLKLKQEKIKDGIKEIFDERGIKMEDHDLVR